MAKQMGSATEGTRTKVAPERKWIRLQEFGLALFLSLPYGLWIGIASGNGVLLGMIILILATGGYCCFRIGYEKRVELRDKETNAQNTHSGL